MLDYLQLEQNISEEARN